MDVWTAAAEAVRAGTPAAFVTITSVGGSAPRHPGARMFVAATGEAIGTIGGGALEHRLIEVARDVATSGTPRKLVIDTVRDLGMCCGGQVEAYVEPLAVRAPFVIFGCGHVAAATAPLLRSLDFAVTVVDARPDLTTADRLPGVELVVDDPRHWLDGTLPDPRCWYLVVTHDHALDLDLVERLLPRAHAWVGLIGSRGKISRFLVRLEAAGVDAATRSRLCGPVGLDIGAETPAEIAVAIAAEVVRLRRGAADRAPMPLHAAPLKARPDGAVPAMLAGAPTGDPTR
jgi:xanthine dehydrogenase accessory factor